MSGRRRRLSALSAAIMLVLCWSAGVAQPDAGVPMRIGPLKNAARCSVDPSGNIYIMDGASGELSKYSKDGKLVCSIGGYGWTSLSFDRPADICSPNGLDVYVADYGNHRIQRFDRNLNFISTLFLRDNPDPDQRFGYPQGVAMDRFGALYVVDGENVRIMKINSSNVVERTFGGAEAGRGRLYAPTRVCVSTDDFVYCQDGNTLAVFDVFGNFVRRIGEGWFNHLRSFTVAGAIVYVVDSCSVRVLGSDGAQIGSADFSTESNFNGCAVNDVAVIDGFGHFLTRTELVVQRRPDFIPAK